MVKAVGQPTQQNQQEHSTVTLDFAFGKRTEGYSNGKVPPFLLKLKI